MSHYKKTMTKFERDFILTALTENGWSLTHTAAYLEIPISSLQRRIRVLRLLTLYKHNRPCRGRPRKDA